MQRHGRAIDRHWRSVRKAHPHETKDAFARTDAQHHHFLGRGREGAFFKHSRRRGKAAQPHILGEAGQPR
jgi:hypothetical protein